MSDEHSDRALAVFNKLNDNLDSMESTFNLLKEEIELMREIINKKFR